MKKHILERRARSLELSQRDTASRCTFCRRPFPHGQSDLLRALGGHVGYCSDNCKADADDARTAIDQEARS